MPSTRNDDDDESAGEDIDIGRGNDMLYSRVVEAVLLVPVVVVVGVGF